MQALVVLQPQEGGTANPPQWARALAEGIKEWQGNPACRMVHGFVGSTGIACIVEVNGPEELQQIIVTNPATPFCHTQVYILTDPQRLAGALEQQAQVAHRI